MQSALGLRFAHWFELLYNMFISAEGKMRTRARHTSYKQPYGREVLCKYVWISHTYIQYKIWHIYNDVTVSVINWRWLTVVPIADGVSLLERDFRVVW
jgi:hypothetical protein